MQYVTLECEVMNVESAKLEFRMRSINIECVKCEA